MMGRTLGRTGRRRLLKKNKPVPKILSSDPAIIELNKWLKNNLWLNDTKLKLACFPQTGRGVMTTQNVDPGDIIIELPYELIMTYTALDNSDNFKSFISSSEDRFYILELLALYLVLEFHLEKYSSWNNYIKSFPTLNDLRVIWLSTEQELGYLNEELSIMVQDEKEKLKESWLRVEPLLKSDYTCWHCGARADQVLTRELYTWAYIIVHTRSVFLDPCKVRAACNDSLEDYLLDEPSMGLCPFLDMFNHSSDTHTQAFLSNTQGVLNYFLVTNSRFKKFDQIFISYGAHDNKRLFTQYGFVLPKNEYDTIEFSLKDILSILKLSANAKQYKFIRDRELDKFVSVSYSGYTFNMAAVLYVLTNKESFDWRFKVFSSQYNKEQLGTINALVLQLVEFRLEGFKNELEQIKIHRLGATRHFEIYVDYLEVRVEFVKEVLNNIKKKFVL